ncbi:hypothetical protein Y1Q_0022998 [Alligator mississippiensis]|uniref:Uncharacterized protein n=1 Tax=Alligator mississippiensis TaxID=8496 RepID=A0A151P7C6_ALLMI|nr:hypothetical protein Y1Q_0022998 [Alligator mississippiensis]
MQLLKTSQPPRLRSMLRTALIPLYTPQECTKINPPSNSKGRAGFTAGRLATASPAPPGGGGCGRCLSERSWKQRRGDCPESLNSARATLL